MEHLTIEEIIDFVSFNKLNDESISLAKKVNLHILKCDECREKVAAYQTICDQFVNIGRNDDLTNVCNKNNETKDTFLDM